MARGPEAEELSKHFRTLVQRLLYLVSLRRRCTTDFRSRFWAAASQVLHEFEHFYQGRLFGPGVRGPSFTNPRPRRDFDPSVGPMRVEAQGLSVGPQAPQVTGSR